MIALGIISIIVAGVAILAFAGLLSYAIWCDLRFYGRRWLDCRRARRQVREQLEFDQIPRRIGGPR
jgi:hypothetical protein